MESTIATKMREERLTSSTVETSDYNSSTTDIDNTRNLSLLYCVLKRLIDIVLATLGIIVLIPLFLVIAVCIKLEDGGQVLYLREMVGLRGRRFTLLKFRTMIPDADTYLEKHPELK